MRLIPVNVLRSAMTTDRFRSRKFDARDRRHGMGRRNRL